jgi:serine/threonine protein kinase
LDTPEPGDASRLDIDLLRRIDAVCGRFESDWRGGRKPRVDDFLADVSAEGRPALRAKLDALVRVLVQDAKARPTDPIAAPSTEAANIPSSASDTVDFAGNARRTEEAITPRPVDTGATAGYDDPFGRTGLAPDLGPEFRRLLAALAPPRKPGELGWLGPYRVLEVLGAGGMGVVFRAEDAQLRREIALKTIRPELALTPENLTRFLREARATAALQHDHIVPIYQVSEERGVPFLAMPLLRGKTLEARLAKEPRLPQPEILQIGREAAEGLAAAHEHGLVHRDIKPANMWLESPTGRVKLLDFGLVRSAGEESGITGSGVILGTPAYMSPEQTSGRTVDNRSDLFSLGCVLYRLATGRPPFQGSDPISTLVAVASAQPKAPREVDPSVPPGLSALIMKLLEKNPDDRPASARAVAEILASLERVPAPAIVPRQAAPSRAVTVAKPQPAPAPLRPPFETQPRRRSAGCLHAFAGCGVVTVAFIILFVAGTAWLLLKGLPKLINVVTEETKRQNEWAEVARVWKPLPADAGPDRLFPKAVAGVPLDHHDTEVDLSDLGIDIAGKHAVYGQGATAVEIFAFRATALEKEALYKRAIEGPKAGEMAPPGQVNISGQNFRVLHGTAQDKLIWYHMSPPDQKGVLWWDQGWLFVARSTNGGDPEPFLRQFLTASSTGEPQR